MIFSATKWDDALELKRFIPVSSALSFEKMESSLSDAYSMFLAPLLGQGVIDVLEEIYTKRVPNAVEKLLLEEGQRAVPNLAFWYNYAELNTRITDMGFQRQESETFKQTYKYQEDQLRYAFKNKGFNSLDKLIQLFDKNIVTYPQFEDSPAYTLRQKAIVRCTEEVNIYHFINYSHIVFLRLKPIFKVVEDTILQQLISADLYNQLLNALDKGTKEIGNTTVEELRQRCLPVVVLNAVAKLIRQTGSVTDRGLYFEQTIADRYGNDKTSPADTIDRIQTAMQLEITANAYADSLTLFIKQAIPECYKGSPSDALNRDNNDKKTFWA